MLFVLKIGYNDRGYGHLAVCGSIHCHTATKVKAGAKPPKSNTPANAHRRVLGVRDFVVCQFNILFYYISVILYFFLGLYNSIDNLFLLSHRIVWNIEV